MASRLKGSVSFLSAHGRKDTLFNNTRCSIFILIIIRPFAMCLDFHFSIIALVKIKWRSNALTLCANATFFVDQDGAQTNRLAGPQPYRFKRVPSLAASLTVYVTFHFLALLHIDEFRHVCFRLFRIPRILKGGFKIGK